MRITLSDGQIVECEPCLGEVPYLDEPEYGMTELLVRYKSQPRFRTPRHAKYPELWSEISKIPLGETITYSELTRRLGLPPTHVRAVARAVGQNNLCLIVPCHRVIRKDGSLGGYRWGVELKQKILDYERSLTL